jgi:hypothetical protein
VVDRLEEGLVGGSVVGMGGSKGDARGTHSIAQGTSARVRRGARSPGGLER